MIDVELLGFVYHWGLDVNSITVIRECPPHNIQKKRSAFYLDGHLDGRPRSAWNCAEQRVLPWLEIRSSRRVCHLCQSYLSVRFACLDPGLVASIFAVVCVQWVAFLTRSSSVLAARCSFLSQS